MSGHSKWSTIKRKKGAKDAARGKIFSRLVKEITVASKFGGGDADGNPRLRSAIDAARRENMPAANIDRAIRKGTGELPGVQIKEVTYEGFAPGGAAILVDTTTDNRNRTVSEIRKVFEKGGGSLGEVNTVAWMFRQVGYFLIAGSQVQEDRLLDVVLEAGADDMTVQDDSFEVVCPPTEFSSVSSALREAGIEPDSQELAKLPQNYVSPEGRDAERIFKLIEKLEDHDDVQSVWTNVDVDPETMERLAAAE